MRRPLLFDSDQLRLHADFSVAAGTLFDNGIGIRHGLKPKGIFFCQFLQKWRSTHDIQTFCTKQTISTNQMNDSLAFLHSIGGLEYQIASFWQNKRTRIRHSVYGVRYATPIQRKPATILNILYGVSRACQTVIIALFFLLLLFWAASLLTAVQFSIIFVYTSGLLIGSVYIHELAHYVWLPDHQHVRFVQQGMRCGLAHAPFQGTLALRTALSGPFAGFIICSIAAGVAFALTQPLAVVIALCLSLIHISALLPRYGDGQSLLKVLRKPQVEAIV